MTATIVSCVSWVKRGVSKKVPDEVQLGSTDLEEMLKVRTTSDDDEAVEIGERPRKIATREDGSKDGPMTAVEVGGDNEDKENEDEVSDEDLSGTDDEELEETEDKKANAEPIDPDNDPYNLAAYDDEEATSAEGLNLSNLVVFSDEKDDPFITMHDDDEVDFEEEKSAFEILDNDNLILAGRAADDCSLLEVYVFNEHDRDLYCHHDLTLPAFPLATQWLNFDPETQQPGNLVAVSSMEPHISIWDLDVVNMLEPVCILGEKPSKGIKKKKKTASSSSGLTGHTDSVLDLSWSSLAPAALASASADFTAALWDLNRKEQILSLKHKEKVQSLEFHPKESSILLTGAFDHYARLFDCRQPDKKPLRWKLNGEVEKVIWDQFSPFNFLASTEAGHIFYMDSRKDKKPLFTISAHESAVTDMTQISDYKNSLVTVGMDATVRIWDLTDHKPTCIYTKDYNHASSGGMTCVEACPDSSTILALGAEKRLMTWDVREATSVFKHFNKDQLFDDSSSKLSQELYELSLATPLEEDDEELREYIDGIADEMTRPEDERSDKEDEISPKKSDKPRKKQRPSNKSEKPPKRNNKSHKVKENPNLMPLGGKLNTDSESLLPPAALPEHQPSRERDAKREVKKAKRRLQREKKRQEAADAEAEALFVRS